MTPPLVARVRAPRLPETRAEIYALERACLKAVKKAGVHGRRVKTEAARVYNDAVAEAGRQVREPETQQTLVRPPEGLTVPQQKAPRGMVQRESGLYVPEAR